MSGRSPDDVTVTAGRGVIWISAAKAYFMATGALLLFTLPHIFGTETYGTFGVVMGIISVLNMVVITGALQATSKFVSEDPVRVESVRRAMFRLQGVVGGVVFLLIFAGAGVIAWLLDDPGLTGPIRVASVVTLSYAFYAVLIGCLNGLHRFRHQALMDITFATLKIGLIILAALAGMGVPGAVAAFSITSVIMLLVARVVLGSHPASEPMPVAPLLRFEALILVFALLLNLLINADLFLIKALSGDRPDFWAGVYTGALALSRLPYQAIIAVTFVIFPLVSRATFLQDADATRQYVTTTLRYSLLLLAALAVSLSAAAPEVVSLVFPPDYLLGVTAVRILAMAYLWFGLLVVTTTIISGSGRPLVSVLILGGVLLVSATLGVILIPARGVTGGALASLIAMGGGAAVSLVYLARRFSARIPAMTWLRLVVVCGVVYIAALLVPTPSSPILLILKCAGTGILFMGGLLVTLEVSGTDLARVRTVLGKRQG